MAERTRKQQLEDNLDRLDNQMCAALAADDDYAIEDIDQQMEIIREDLNAARNLAKTLKAECEALEGDAGSGFDNALETFGVALDEDPEFWQFAIDSAQMLRNG